MAPPKTLRDALRFLVTELDRDLEAGRCAMRPPALLRVDAADIDPGHRHIDLHAKALDGHPARVLAGFTAPPDWIVVGVVAEGGTGPRRAARVRIISLLSRTGVEVSALHPAGGALQLIDEVSEGRVADTLRRVLGLATPEPRASVAQLLTLCWLDAIVSAGGRGTRARRLGWDEAAALHPVAQMDRGSDPLSPYVLPAVAARRAARMDWDRLRRCMAEGGSELAAWMDAGMFARWMIGSRPPLDVLRKQAARRLTHEAVTRMEVCLASWGLAPSASVA